MPEWIYYTLLVWGILNIILFFKIWRMTNDVSTMKNIILAANTSDINIKVGDFVYSFRHNKVCMVRNIRKEDRPYECISFDTAERFYLKEEEIVLIKKEK